jgi:MmeI, DNA-methyltransferase domain/MmeI, helicase spacer domain/MmeI, N-terminal domain/MmeI, target recognition domain
MTPAQFIAKWKPVTLSERSACQQHFLDLCEVLGQPKPAAVDKDGSFYTFERGVKTDSGGQGWADVWLRGHFAWEYKGKHKDLKAAYDQLQKYREPLENPPLLVVCDMDRFEVHTNFTGTAKKVYAFALDGLAEAHWLDVLRKLFTEPDELKPGETVITVTELAAGQFARLADGLRNRGVPADRAAHFLMKLMFCMFAEDIDLLPEDLFTRTVENSKGDPKKLSKMLGTLFAAMAKGDYFGAEEIAFFNGGLFDDADTIDLTGPEIEELLTAARFDWGSVEPSIFGTLFERSLDPDKRSQLGAHYTSREDIETLTVPVVMVPLRREWDAVRAKADSLWEKVRAEVAAQATKKRSLKPAAPKKSARAVHDKLFNDFIERLAHVTILDPACGSGNFLYVAIRLLLDLEKEVLTYAAGHDTTLTPRVRPTQLSGLEINPYAQELAQVVIWIGFLQWKHDNGYDFNRDPILDKIETIHRTDAILDPSDPANPKEPEWPDAEFIIGNPPFLGGKLLRDNLGDEYVDAMFRVYGDRVPPPADLCCYWFEKARARIEARKTDRAGLLATQGIRGGENREVVKRIKKSGGIFFAESDRDWILDGANVRVSMIGFDAGNDKAAILDGKAVTAIHSNLSGGADTTSAQRIRENLGIAFMGDTKGGAFDIPSTLAITMARSPNPHDRPSSDVVVPWCNGMDVTRRDRDMWIIDFGLNLPDAESAKYEMPFQYLREHVHPIRATNKRESYRLKWWIHVEARPAMRSKLRPLPRFLVTTTVSKHRLFAWMAAPTLPDRQLIVFALDDDFSFGVLHSRVHEVWGLKQGTRLEDRPRYTPTSTFETFPLPQPTPPQREAIAAAAKALDELRSNWLNPPEWTRIETLEFPGSVDGPWARYVHEPDARGIGTVRYPRRVAKDDDAKKQLAKRTLTNLYNQKPEWLQQAHRRLDGAVFAAYGWNPAMSDDDLLAALLKLNLERARDTRSTD